MELTADQIAFLESIDREVCPETSVPSQTALLYHYTNADSFRSIVTSRELWATHFQFANDTGEITYGEALVLRQAQEALASAEDGPTKALFERVVDLLSTAPATAIFDVYVASLSEDGDQLSQWRAYGQDGAGVAIGFRSFPPATGNPNDATAGLSLMRCSYDEEAFALRASEFLGRAAQIWRDRGWPLREDRHLLPEVLKKVAFAAARGLIAQALQLKHPAFKEEREWRLVVIAPKDGKNDFVRFRQTPLGSAPYVPISLGSPPDNARCDIGRVVVGPGQNALQAEISARLFLQQGGYIETDLVVPSKIPYRGARH